MVKPRIYADFHNTDAAGRLRLNCIGTVEDLSRQQVELREGLLLTVYSDDLGDDGEPDELLADGIASFSEEAHCWVATIDRATVRHASDGVGAPVAGGGRSTPSRSAGGE